MCLTAELADVLSRSINVTAELIECSLNGATAEELPTWDTLMGINSFSIERALQVGASATAAFTIGSRSTWFASLSALGLPGWLSDKQGGRALAVWLCIVGWEGRAEACAVCPVCVSRRKNPALLAC